MTKSLIGRGTKIARAALIESTAHRSKRASFLVQLFRYGIAGGISAAVYATVFLLLAVYVFGDRYATVAVVPAFAVSLGVSFVGHSKWSFAGHGERTPGLAQPVRFASVQSVGLLMNLAFTYVATVVLHLDSWAALVPSLTLTPITTFLIHRFWVFR